MAFFNKSNAKIHKIEKIIGKNQKIEKKKKKKEKY